MKSYDAIIIGAGIIGLSLAIELRKKGLRVLLVEKGEPGREASWAAGGMLMGSGMEMPEALHSLAAASAAMYPEFVHELEDESRLKIDLRSEGALHFEAGDGAPAGDPASSLRELEPALAESPSMPLLVKEQCVDPRDVVSAAVASARHRGVDFSSGDEALSIEVTDGTATGLRTNKTRFTSGVVINCAGAWAGRIPPHALPTRPVKGQMLSVVMPEKNLLRHVIRAPEVYLIPRSDGRLLIGATVEEVGFDKRTVPETIQRLREAAIALVPGLAKARILEAWAGLRPATPDKLPILGPTPTLGYFVATGHYRDGILLAPITAAVMAALITDAALPYDLSAFSATRFL